MKNPYNIAQETEITINVTKMGVGVYDLLVEQLGHECYNGLLYWRLAADCDLMGYTGAAKYFNKRSLEEKAHAQRIYAYLLDKQTPFCIPQINSFVLPINSLKEAFIAALSAELETTSRLSTIYPQLDILSSIWFQWFLTEQIEEEATIKNILDRIELANNNPSGLLLVDNDISQM